MQSKQILLKHMNLKKEFKIIEEEFNKQGSLSSMLLINTQKGRVVVGFAGMPKESELKQRMLFNLGREIVKKGFEANWIIFSSEAWFKLLEKGEKMPSGYISDQPDRKECLVLTLVTKDNKSESLAREIVREGKKKELGQEVVSKDFKIENPLLREFWRGYIYEEASKS